MSDIITNPIDDAKTYLYETAPALGLRNVDASRPLSDQREDILIDMGAQISKQGPKGELEPYRVFWSVYRRVMDLEDKNAFADHSSDKTPEALHA